MITAEFSVFDKLRLISFFKEIFLSADISMEIILGISFFLHNHIDIDFKVATRRFIWRTYTGIEAMSMVKRVKPIDKYKFIKAIFNKNSETFIIYVAALKALTAAISIHFSRVNQLLAKIA